MVSHARERPKLTAKGERARARIVAASDRLIRQRGVAGTTLEDVKAAADVRGSQLYHYFPDKDDLVQPSSTTRRIPPSVTSDKPISATSYVFAPGAAQLHFVAGGLPGVDLASRRLASEVRSLTRLPGSAPGSAPAKAAAIRSR